MNAEKISTASAEIVSIRAGICSQMFAIEAARITRKPTNSHLPMPVKSRLETVAMVAMTAKMPAVPPKAVMISEAPLEKPSTWPISRESISPMKKVKPSSRPTPITLFLNLSMAKKNPKATARKTMMPMNGLPEKNENPLRTPIQAPRTVGTIDRASSA